MSIVKTKNRAATVLALLSGDGRIVVKDEKYTLDSLGNLCVVRDQDDDTEIYLRVSFGEVTLAQFIGWANAIPDDDLTIACANKALTEIRREGVRGVRA